MVFRWEGLEEDPFPCLSQDLEVTPTLRLWPFLLFEQQCISVTIFP